MNGPPLEAGFGLAAAAPVVLLLALVLWGRWGALIPAAASLLLGVCLALTVFQADLLVVSVALGKGFWLALWILLVVWPALLLFRIASVGGLDRLGEFFTSILPRRRENLLIVAWLFPSFIQGVAGFGTPIAMSAPLLVAMGWGPVRAVAYPLIGYHWSVTFGSMGSSFYMASLTARLDSGERIELAVTAGLFLAANCLVAGALVLLLDGGWQGLREGWRVLLTVGVPMAATLVGVAALVPAVATLAAGAAGFLVVLALNAVHRRRSPSPGASSAPDSGRGAGASPLVLLMPYLYLLVVALPVYLIPASRAWVHEHVVIAPDFPATATRLGWRNGPAGDYSPLAVLAHPGSYIALACLLGYLTFRRRGLWCGTAVHGIGVSWLRALPKASYSIVILGCLAMLLVDAGMVSVLARGSADLVGDAYPALAPSLGALGSFMTGSTTSSNALLSSFQAGVADLVGVDRVLLVAAQTAGGNVGNSLAPVVVLVGVGAVGAADAFSRVVRMCLLPAAVLLLFVSALTMLGAAL
jgi:lactate permease